MIVTARSSHPRTPELVRKLVFSSYTRLCFTLPIIPTRVCSDRLRVLFLYLNDFTAGRSKLLTLAEEIRRLAAIEHPLLQQVYAVKLSAVDTKTPIFAFTPASPRAGPDHLALDGRRALPNDSHRAGYMRLCVLLERSPQLILDEVLAQCENFKKDRAIVRCFLCCRTSPSFSLRRHVYAQRYGLLIIYTVNR